MQHGADSRVEHADVMDDAPAIELPDDVAALKALCTSYCAQVAERDVRIGRMVSEILWLRKQLYGPRADRLSSTADLGQMLMDFAAG